MRTEEKEILYCLRTFGTLKKHQVVEFIQKPKSLAEKIVNGLIRQQYIFERDGYLMTSPRKTQPDERIITAFTVMEQFEDHITSDNYYAADFPAQIYFISNNEAYEVVVFQPGDEYIFPIICNKAKNKNSETHYIFAANGKALFTTMYDTIPWKDFDEQGIKADYAVVESENVSWLHKQDQTA